jgi:hypothetical protein
MTRITSIIWTFEVEASPRIFFQPGLITVQPIGIFLAADAYMVGHDIQNNSDSMLANITAMSSNWRVLRSGLSTDGRGSRSRVCCPCGLLGSVRGMREADLERFR